MLFKNRKEAGEKLSLALEAYRRAPKTIVVGLPRGGVVVAFEVAQALELPLDLLTPRKIGAPNNAELAIGALAGEEVLLDKELIASLGVSQAHIEQEIAKEKREAARRLMLYRKGKPSQDFRGWSILLIDDGIATGSTMRASLAALRSMGASKIVVAVPVAPPETVEKLKQEADIVVCLHTPRSFMAVGQFYDDFPQTTDQEVISLLAKSESFHRKRG